MVGLVLISSSVVTMISHTYGGRSVRKLSDQIIESIAKSVVDNITGYLQPASYSGFIGKEMVHRAIIDEIENDQIYITEIEGENIEIVGLDPESRDFGEVVKKVNKIVKFFKKKQLKKYHITTKELKLFLISKIAKSTQMISFFHAILRTYSQISLLNYGNYDKDKIMVKEMLDGTLSMKYVFHYPEKGIAITCWDHKSLKFYDYSKIDKRLSFGNKIQRLLPQKIKIKYFETNILNEISNKQTKNFILSVYSKNNKKGSYILQNRLTKEQESEIINLFRLINYKEENPKRVYDATKRPWFKGAEKNYYIAKAKGKDARLSSYWTQPYVFSSDQIPGISCSIPVINKSGKMVGAISVSLEIYEISAGYLANLKIGNNGKVFILNNKAEMLAYAPEQFIPKKLGLSQFENDIIDILKNNEEKKFVLSLYDKDSNKGNYILKKDLTYDQRSQFINLLKRSPKYQQEKNRLLKKELQSLIKVGKKKKSGKIKYVLTSIHDFKNPLFKRAFEESDLKPAQTIKKKKKTINIYKLEKSLRFHFTYKGEPYLGAISPFPKTSQWKWMVFILIPEDDLLAEVKANTYIITIVSIIAVILSTVISIFISSSISKPLKLLVHETERIRNFDLTTNFQLKSRLTEVQQMVRSFNNMETGLRSFEKFVPSDIVRYLIQSGQEATLGGDNKTLTVFFSDIVGFTSISEALSPKELVSALGEYLSEMSDIVKNNEGTVDKYIGDAVMAFWNAPKDCADHAFLACKAAIESQRKLASLRFTKWKKERKPLFEARIGLNTGELIVGNMGSSSRLNYTVIGDTVNLASRLEAINKYYGTTMNCSEFTYNLVKDRVVLRKLDLVTVKGKKEAVGIYEIVALKGETDKRQEKFISKFEEGIDFYLNKNFKDALKLFTECFKLKADTTSDIYIKRCEEYIERQPAPDWNGVYVFTQK